MWYSQFWSSVVGFIEGGARREPSSGCRDPSSSGPGIPSTVFQYQYEESPVGILMTWAKVEFSGVGINGVSVPVTRVLVCLPASGPGIAVGIESRNTLKVEFLEKD